MHKETVNTFTKGMIKDTHPLTTPADVLTDCLNGTLITYNGNEMILQNDMGNVQIGSAELPAGYVPVGITEYGGIIYVASYNPKTGKGQIGSFPSPQQVHQSEIWSVNDTTATIEKTFKSSDFYDGTTDNIIRTELKYNLGQADNNEYIIHTGDKIEITGIPENDYIETQFAVLKSDGSLEVVEGNYLGEGSHVYTGKSSGVPVIIVKLLTLKSFNLEREYSRGTPTQNEDTVTITFTGRFEEEKEGLGSNPVLGYKGTGGDYTKSTNNPATQFIVENQPMSGTYTQDFIPILNQGNLISMKKSVSIDLSKFKKDTYELKNWSYFVTDSYVKINWSFDYYTLDQGKEVNKITFCFHPISSIGSASYTYDIEKESYNGSFEEIINFSDSFTKNNIYLVKIKGKVSNNEEIHLGNRLIYTSGIFNDYYGRVKDFTNKGFADDLPEVMWNPGSDVLDTDDPWNNSYRKDLTIKIIPDIEVTNNSEENNVSIENPNGQITSISKKNVKGDSFITISEDRGTGYYNISIKNKYGFRVNLRAEVKEDSLIVGNPCNETIQAVLSAFKGSNLVFTDESVKFGTLRVQNEFASALQEFSDNAHGKYDAGDQYNEGFLTYEWQPQEEEEAEDGVVIESKILAKASSIMQEEVERIGLAPLYYDSMDAATKNKAFSAWNVNNPLFVAGADEAGYKYNATLAGGNVSGGTSAGAGYDDTGLCTAIDQMGSPMVCIAAGTNGDEASYSPDSGIVDYTKNDPSVTGKLRRRNVAGWNCGSNEIDGTDDFLIATWKQTDSKYRFSVLASHKVHKQPGRLNRLDYMLRSLLSQLFTKQAYKYNLKYITVNPDEYGYYNPVISVEVNLQLNEQVNYNNVEHSIGENANELTSYDITIGDHMIYTYLNQDKYSEDSNNPNPEGIKKDEIMLVRYDIIPEIGDNKKVFTNDSYTEEVANLLTGATYSGKSINNDKSNECWIYVPDWTKIRNAQSTIYEINSDGTVNWLLTDMTPYLKLSGTKDGSGYVYTDDDGVNKVSQNGSNFSDSDPEYKITPTSNIDDPLSNEQGSPGSRNISIVSNSYGPIGDVLRWNNTEWPFYHSFQHMFKTYCQWMDSSVKPGVFNEIVVNRDSYHAGEKNSSGMWRNNKDASAPDIFACLGNSYNSIYGRMGEVTSGIN